LKKRKKVGEKKIFTKIIFGRENRVFRKKNIAWKKNPIMESRLKFSFSKLLCFSIAK
jgi:hypothetical protein